MEMIFLMSAHYYIHYYGLPLEMVRSRLGMCCVIFNVLTAASPLEALVSEMNIFSIALLFQKKFQSFLQGQF